jgi:glycerol-3-phosphate dehydrogenase
MPRSAEKLRASNVSQRYLPGMPLPDTLRLTSDPAATLADSETLSSALP